MRLSRRKTIETVILNIKKCFLKKRIGKPEVQFIKLILDLGILHGSEIIFRSVKRVDKKIELETGNEHLA